MGALLLIAAVGLAALVAMQKSAGEALTKSKEKPAPAPDKPASSSAPAKAARLLFEYWKEGGRSKDKIAAHQKIMGKITPDGVVGPATKKRAEELLKQSLDWSTKPAPKPAPRPAPAPAPAEASAEAARRLHTYYSGGGRSKDKIAAHQKIMGKITPDGVVGPATKKRAEELLKQSLDWKDKYPPPPAEKGPIESTLSLVPGAKDDTAAKNAAEELWYYYRSGGRDRAKIGAYQKTIGGLTADGLVGPLTKGRVNELLGASMDWGDGKPAAAPASSSPAPAPAPAPIASPPPASKVVAVQPAPTAPAVKPAPKKKPAAAPPTASKVVSVQPAAAPAGESAAAVKAAKDLEAYVKGGGRYRSTISDYQRTMGKIDPDGNIGAGTKSRIETLLARSSSIPMVTATGSFKAPADPAAAAREFYNYRKLYGGSLYNRIVVYQKAIGVSPDGLIGPTTKAKVKSLTGLSIS